MTAGTAPGNEAGDPLVARGQKRFMDDPTAAAWRSPAWALLIGGVLVAVTGLLLARRGPGVVGRG